MDENLIIVDYALNYEVYTVANANEILRIYSPLRRGIYSNRKNTLLKFSKQSCCPSEVMFRQSIYLVAYWDIIYVWKKLQPWYNRMTSATVLEMVWHLILMAIVKAI